jgi:hypothetical protein
MARSPTGFIGLVFYCSAAFPQVQQYFEIEAAIKTATAIAKENNCLFLGVPAPWAFFLRS